MIAITFVIGNVHADVSLSKVRRRLAARGGVETVVISRVEAQRSRMRRRSNAGTDIGVTLEEGQSLRHGDVLLVEKNRMIVVEYEPEDVLEFRVRASVPVNERLEVGMKLGHMIGNLHRPIATRKGAVLMPLQTEAEAENIERAMGPLASKVGVRRVRDVFEPADGTGGHAH